MRTLLIVVLTAIIGISSFALTGNGNEAAPPQPQQPQQQDPNMVIATVNGIKITYGQVEQKIAPQLQQMQSQLPPQFIEQYKQQMIQQAVEGVIVEQLLEEKAQEENITISDAEVTAQLEEIASQQQPPLSAEDFKELVQAYGRSWDDVRAEIKKGLTFQKLVDSKTDFEKAGEDQAKEFYEENPDEFLVPAQVRASHILITPEDKESDESKAQAKAKAEDILKQLNEGDADFAAMAKEHSGCPSGENGGELGMFGRGQMVPAFEEAAFNLPVGEISDVVETDFGYHIIKVSEKTEAKTVSYEEAKEDILNMLNRQAQARAIQKYVEQIKSEATVVYSEGFQPAPAPAPMQ